MSNIAVIGRFYKKLKDAELCRKRMENAWQRKISFFVVSYPKGNMVISESSARQCFPDFFPKKKYGRTLKNINEVL